MSETEIANSLAMNGCRDPWWRYFIDKIITPSHTYAVSNLISSNGSDLARENRLRGNIEELSKIINLDNQAKKLIQEKEKRS